MSWLCVIRISRFFVGRTLREKHKLPPGGGTTRREYLDHLLFFNGRDLQNKLDQFQTFYNDVRAHSSLKRKTPTAMAFGEASDEKVVSIDHYRWKKRCNDLYQLPVAA